MLHVPAPGQFRFAIVGSYFVDVVPEKFLVNKMEKSDVRADGAKLE